MIGDTMSGINLPQNHPLHAKLRAYTQERQRQEAALEDQTFGWKSEEDDWKARGGKLITWKDWLKADKAAGQQNPVSNEHYTPDPSWGADEAPPW